MTTVVTTLQQDIEDISLYIKSEDGSRKFYDYGPDFIYGLPIGNFEIQNPQNVKSIEIIEKIKKAEQLSSFEDRLAIYNDLQGDSLYEKQYIREYLTSLKASSSKYETSINNVLANIAVSDNICLETIGHTIDTMALDPEDWFSQSFTGPSDRLLHGPASLIPVTSKYKINADIQAEAQAAYEQLHRMMYFNIYRDRYYVRNELDAQFSDYPVTRYGSGNYYGYKVFTTSHINMGDGASVGFSKVYNTSDERVSQIYSGDSSNSKSLIKYDLSFYKSLGYSEAYKNVIKTPSKMSYTTTFFDIERGVNVDIIIEKTGARLLLPSVNQDTTSVKPF